MQWHIHQCGRDVLELHQTSLMLFVLVIFMFEEELAKGRRIEPVTHRILSMVTIVNAMRDILVLIALSVCCVNTTIEQRRMSGNWLRLNLFRSWQRNLFTSWRSGWLYLQRELLWTELWNRYYIFFCENMTNEACPGAPSAVCSGRGTCVFNSGTSIASCKCDPPYYGLNCENGT